ncbi:MAG: glutamine amidotransferase [Planctomycetota bacterium]
MQLIILKTGSTVPRVLAQRGDFEHWIAAAAQVAFERFQVIDVVRGDALPQPSPQRPVIITGSPASVHDREPWSERAAAWLREAVAREVPVLGICYGHQLLAHALGGRVGRNPNGREVGVRRVWFEESDLLFEDLSSPLEVYESHSDAVLEPPAGARVLARNDHTFVQAFAVGRHTRGVQWHPEFDAEILRGYLDERAAEIDRESGPGTAARLRAEVVELPSGRILMRNFLRHLTGLACRD